MNEIWVGRGGFFFTRRVVFLYPLTLQVKPFGRSFEIRLEDVEKVRVHQGLLDKISGRGDLQIEIRGREKPLFLRRILNPYEGWKQIKIAAFLARKGKRDSSGRKV